MSGGSSRRIELRWQAQQKAATTGREWRTMDVRRMRETAKGMSEKERKASTIAIFPLFPTVICILSKSSLCKFSSTQARLSLIQHTARAYTYTHIRTNLYSLYFTSLPCALIFSSKMQQGNLGAPKASVFPSDSMCMGFIWNPFLIQSRKRGWEERERIFLSTAFLFTLPDWIRMQMSCSFLLS